ncbi:MAG: peptidase [Proteobacteria bacterium SG_bin5]|nr:MAG: peptidase [Proteobacteria bacterium SG_bin5]
MSAARGLAWALIAAAAPVVAQAPASPFKLEGPLVQGGAAQGIVPAGTTLLELGDQSVPIARDGRFLIAFDRDAPPSLTLSATLSNGEVIRQTLAIAPRAWRIERLPTLPKIAQPTAEFEATRPGEIAQIDAARHMTTSAEGWRQPLLWPATGRLSGLFGAQRIYANGEAGSYHSGADIARPEGTPVLAPADGVVVLAADRPFTLEGNLLMIDHGMGLSSSFLHLSRIDVKRGQRVSRGQVIGAIGKTGRATGPHLHWSLRWREARIDPLLVAGPMPSTK